MEQDAAIQLLNFCVIIPTYNNQKTLARVLDSVLQYTANVMVVNDGSTDDSASILNRYPNIHQIHLSQNQGKGKALREGFKRALTLGFEYAITIDSDGQHFAADLPILLSEIQSNGDALLIGSRNMKQQGVPGKSSFGNKFSNFWFWFETGVRLEDTQSGYRLYPLLLIPKKYFTNKFEFEIEVIVRSAWKGLIVKNVPIQVLYDPAERVSHFRPFQDFTRISLLNTVLVIITILYIKPRDAIRSFRRKGLKKFFFENVMHSTDSNTVKSLSIAWGIFIGLSPFWGLQTVLLFFFAALFRLNKAISFLFSNVSLPPFIPFIIYVSLKIGGYVTATEVYFPSFDKFHWESISSQLTQYLIGSLLLASSASAFFGISSYLFLTFFSTFKNKK